MKGKSAIYRVPFGKKNPHEHASTTDFTVEPVDRFIARQAGSQRDDYAGWAKEQAVMRQATEVAARRNRH